MRFKKSGFRRKFKTFRKKKFTAKKRRFVKSVKKIIDKKNRTCWCDFPTAASNMVAWGPGSLNSAVTTFDLAEFMSEISFATNSSANNIGTQFN